MEEKPRSALSNGIYYGMIVGAAIIVFSLLLFLMDLHMNKSVSWISYLILCAGLILGTLDFRKKHSNGFLTYGKAFVSCFWIGLFAGLLASIFTFVFAKYIHPGFINEILDQTRASLLEKRPEMTDEQVEQAVEITAKFVSPPFMALGSVFMYAGASAILGLILAIFLKKEDPSLNSAM
ncbi:MAG: DUF4199 domain-containing protein [Bacteroidota bacterium]